jgi:hypothetical protein
MEKLIEGVRATRTISAAGKSVQLGSTLSFFFVRTTIGDTKQ